MANNNGLNFSSGTVEGTGSAIEILAGFRPKSVTLNNIDGKVTLSWDLSMQNGYGYKTLGGAANPTFVGATPGAVLDLNSPVFSGTGLTGVGNVSTTTDNQTMTLNQCAGMWLLAEEITIDPVLIISNTAVTNAPAVLTVKSSITAPDTAGTYKIVTCVVPTGTISGAGGISSLITSGGITPTARGFIIGTDTDVNVNAETINWTATR